MSLKITRQPGKEPLRDPEDFKPKPPGPLTVLAGATKSLLFVILENRRNEFEKGKDFTTIAKDLKEVDGLSDHNVKRIIQLIKGEPIPPDIKSEDVRLLYRIKENTIRVTSDKDLGYKRLDLVFYNSEFFIVQQVDVAPGDFCYILKKENQIRFK